MTRSTLSWTKSRLAKFLLLGLLGLGVAIAVVVVDHLNRGELLRGFDNFVTDQGSSYRQWFRQQNTSNLLILLPLAFIGGLVASISPCILALLPVNLSYIGTRTITSRGDALVKAGSFVLGVVTVLTLFGLFSSLQGFVLIRYQGYVQVVVGVLIVIMGLSLAGMVRLPLPQFALSQSGNFQSERGDRRDHQPAPANLLARVKHQVHQILTGPYGVGLTFALVSSPCTSPVTFAILGAAAATGSPWQSTLVMLAYAVGYTAIIFFASLFAGLAKQTRALLEHAETVTRFASILLLIVGGFYLVNGSRWIMASLRIA